VADFASQALVGCLLSEAFPRDRLVGEEDSADLGAPEHRPMLEQVARFVACEVAGATPEMVCRWIDVGRGAPDGRFWTLDPVDGTKGFLRGGQYAVALALLVDGRVRLGVLGCPHLVEAKRQEIGGPGTLVVAEAGRGAWAAPLSGGEFRRLQVSQRNDPAEARVLRSFEAGHTNVDALGELVKALGARTDPILMDSQAKYALLAAGEGDLLFRLLAADKPAYRETIWDQAAGSLVVEEAGGRITDLEGKPLDFSHGRTLARNRGVVASNDLLHEVALEAIRRIEAS
jgi:3'(2'), 5'-bisphosphate nucleotidase